MTPFAATNFRNQKRKFGIKTDDRRRHMYIIGKTGMGKSVLIENMVYSDIASGNGACLIDPHGDSAELLVDCIPSNRINDVIYVNPADMDFRWLLTSWKKLIRNIVIWWLLVWWVFSKRFGLIAGVLVWIYFETRFWLYDYPDSTLLGVNRMLTDKVSKKVIAKIQDR